MVEFCHNQAVNLTRRVSQERKGRKRLMVKSSTKKESGNKGKMQKREESWRSARKTVIEYGGERR